jgi:uncharacterized protein YegL
MRRLPVFFLIDVSESMVGDPIINVNRGIDQITSNLKSNPMALETAYISIIIFAGKARLISPLTELLQFTPPNLNIGGGTALGRGLNFLMDEMEKQIWKTTHDRKGDWKPIVFLITDGAPTDNVTSAVTRWNEEFKTKANLVAVSIGDQADTAVLQKITEHVVVFNDADKKSYSKFFEWVSASIEMKSINITAGSNDLNLPELDQVILQKGDIHNLQSNCDERFAILLVRCQKKKSPYLVKYIKKSPGNYISIGAYTVSEEYFRLTSSEGSVATMGSESITSVPPCPECGHERLAWCSCKHLFCIGNDGRYKCPWCNKKVDVKFSGGFDFTKTQG